MLLAAVHTAVWGLSVAVCPMKSLAELAAVMLWLKVLLSTARGTLFRKLSVRKVKRCEVDTSTKYTGSARRTVSNPKTHCDQEGPGHQHGVKDGGGGVQQVLQVQRQHAGRVVPWGKREQIVGSLCIPLALQVQQVIDTTRDPGEACNGREHLVRKKVICFWPVLSLYMATSRSSLAATTW
jgi:hypothetical protein